MSQLGLSAAAGTTPRHLSFVETGRSRPGQELVLRIAEVLAVPLPDRNALLAAAGLPPEYPEHELGSAELAAVEQVLDRVLAGHEPYPAWVARRPFTFLRANKAAEGLFPGLTDLPAGQLIDLWFGPRAVPRQRPELAPGRARRTGHAAPGCGGHRRPAGHRLAAAGRDGGQGENVVGRSLCTAQMSNTGTGPVRAASDTGRPAGQPSRWLPGGRPGSAAAERRAVAPTGTRRAYRPQRALQRA
jgi:transcriptional regulator with XRE-family HTH domain